jgi:Resolvase, N terminal domain
VKARKIDVVVVYKVDRLMRPLADFAKLVELFEPISRTTANQLRGSSSRERSIQSKS